MTVPDREFMDRIHQLAKRIHKVEGSLPVIDRVAQREQWAAWRQWRVENRQPVSFMDRQNRFTVLTAWPPGDFEELEAQYAGKGKSVRRLAT